MQQIENPWVVYEFQNRYFIGKVVEENSDLVRLIHSISDIHVKTFGKSYMDDGSARFDNPEDAAIFYSLIDKRCVNEKEILGILKYSFPNDFHKN